MEDPGTLILAAIATFAAGISAIVAWFARSDSLRAADRAEEAERAALKAWQDTAIALKESNELSASQHAERLARERKVRRVEVAEHFRRWYTEDAVRRVMGQHPSAKERAEKRDLAIRLTGTGEPGASALATKVIEAATGVVESDMKTALMAAATIASNTHSWVEDPEAYSEATRDDFTPERVVDTLQEALDGFEAVMAAMKSEAGQPRTNLADSAKSPESG